MSDETLLYDLTDSPFCAKARICLQLKGIPFRRVTLTLGRLRELRQLSTLGKVPVLVQGGRVIADSTAIVRHLETLRPDPPLRPSDPAARAYCDVIEDWADESLSHVVGAFKWLNPANRAAALRNTMHEIGGGPLSPLIGRVLALRVARRYRGEGYGPDAMPHFEERMRDSLQTLEQLIGDRPLLLGRTITVADVAVYAQLSWMRNYVEKRLLDDVPGVAAWLARLDDVPAVSSALSS